MRARSKTSRNFAERNWRDKFTFIEGEDDEEEKKGDIFFMPARTYIHVRIFRVFCEEKIAKTCTAQSLFIVYPYGPCIYIYIHMYKCSSGINTEGT